MKAKTTTNIFSKKGIHNAFFDRRVARLSSMAWSDAGLISTPIGNAEIWHSSWQNTRAKWLVGMAWAQRWARWIVLAALLATFLLPFPNTLSLPPVSRPADFQLRPTKTVWLDSEAPTFALTLPGTVKPDDFKINRVVLTNSKQEALESPYVVLPGATKSEMLVQLDHQSPHQPGKMAIEIRGNVAGQPTTVDAEILWGVVAVNVRRSIAPPGQAREIQLAVLDDFGRTVCDSHVELSVIDPSGQEKSFSTDDGGVINNPDCQDRSVTNQPDYHVDYLPELDGNYQVTVTAETPDGSRTIADSFTAQAAAKFDVERTEFPTRIYPPAQYPVSFKVVPAADFSGFVTETLPAGYLVPEVSQGGAATANNNEPVRIDWAVNWQAGQVYTLGYTFKAPDISPVLYHLGPIKFTAAQDVIFQESRRWQIAADATKTWDGGGADANWSTCANWNADTCPANTGDAIVFDGTSGGQTNDASTWEDAATITSVASISFTSYSGVFTISKTSAAIAGDFSHASTGNVVFTTSVSCAGNFTLTTSGSFTPNTTTLTMTGTGGKNLNSSKSLYNLTIDPSSTATINVITNSFTVTNTLNVAAGDTMDIATGITVTHTGTTLTWGDASSTISGAGTLTFTSTSGGPGTSGVLSSIVRYDSTSVAIPSTTIDARTYSGRVEVYSNATAVRTVALPSGNFILSGASSHLYIIAANTAGMALTGVANAPTFTIGGDLDFTGAGSGLETLRTGAGAWSVAGNVDVRDGTFVAATNNTFSMTGAGKTLYANGGFYNLTFNTAGTIYIVGGTAITNTLTISTGTTVTFYDVNAYLDGAATFVLDGTISGPGWFYYYDTNGTFPTTGTVSCPMYFYLSSANMTIPARTYGNNVFVQLEATGYIATLGTATGQTVTISGYLYVDAYGAGNLTLDAATYDPIVIVGGDLDFTGGGAGLEIITAGVCPWTVSGNVNFTGGTYTTETGGSCGGASADSTLAMNGTGKTLTSGGNTLQDYKVTGGSITLADATAIAGNLVVMTGGTLTTGATALTVTGTTTVTGGGLSLTNDTGAKTFVGLVSVSGGTISGTSTNVIVRAGITQSSSGAFTMTGSGTILFDTASAVLTGTMSIPIITVTSPGTVTNNGTVTMTGVLSGNGSWTQGTSSTLNNSLVSGTVISVTTFNASTNANTVDYNGAGNQTCRVVTYKTLKLSTSGTKTCAVTAVNTLLETSGTVTMSTGANLTTNALTVGTGTTFNAAGYDLTVTNTTSVTGILDFTASTSGTKLFSGAITVNAGGVFQNTINEGISFRAGITMNGTTFNTGTGAIIFTASQALAGSSNMTFGGSATINAGFTLTNNNLATVLFSGAITGADGAASFATGASSLTQFANTVMATGTLVPSTSAHTIQYTGASQAVKLPTTNPYYHLTLSGSGTPTLSASMSAITGNFAISGSVAVDTAATLTVGLDVTVATATTFNVNHDLTINGGDFTNAGTGKIDNTSGTPTITVSGAGSIGGVTGSTKFYNLTLSGTPTFASSYTVKNNLTLPASVTAGSTTVTMSGTAGTLVGGGSTIYNLTIDPSSTGTITLNTSDLTVANTLNVAAADTLSIATGRVLTHTGSTLTWGDSSSTISGAGTGTLRFTDASGGPGTDGVISAITRFDAGNGNIASTTFDARTYSGQVELYNSGGSAKTVSCADASTYTFSGGSSHLYLYAEGAGSMTLLCDTTTDPTVTIGGDIDFVGSGIGSESITTGSGVWTVSGNVTLTDGTLTATSGNTLVMNSSTTTKTLTSNTQTLQNLTLSGKVTLANAVHTVAGNLDLTGSTLTVGTSTITMTGTSNSITGGEKILKNLTIDPASAGTISLVASDLALSGLLTVETGDALSIGSGLLLTTASSGTSVTLNGTGTISGSDGTLIYQTATAFPTTGTVSCIVRFDLGYYTTTQTISGRTYGSNVEVNSTTQEGASSVVTLGTGPINISGSLILTAGGFDSLTLTGLTNGPAVNITGDLDIANSPSNTETIITGTGTWTVSGNVDLTSGVLTATAGHTLVMNNSGATKTLTSNGQTLQNLTISGVVTLADAVHTVAGNLVLTGATLTPGSSTINMTGTSNSITGGGVTLANLTINPSSAGTITLSSSDLSVSSLLTVTSSDELALGAGRNLTLTGTSGTTLSLSGTISGTTGRLIYSSTEAFPTGGTITSILRMDTTGRSGMALSDRSSTDYGGTVEIYNNSGSASSIAFTIGTGSSQTINFGSHLYVICDNVQGVAVAADTYDPTINVTGDIDFTGVGATDNQEQLNFGDGTWTVGGNINFTDGYAAGAASTLIMSGTSKTLTSDANSLNNFNVTGTISTVDAADINGTFTVTTGSFTQGANVNLNIFGDFTLESGTTFTAASGTGKVIFDGDLWFNDKNASKQDIGNVEIGASPDTTDMASDMTVKSLKVLATDILNTHGYDIDSAGNITVLGELNATDDGEGDSTIINCAGNFNISSGAAYTADNSTLIMDATGTVTKTIVTDGDFNLYNLTINDGGGANNLTVQVSDALVLKGSLTITGGNLDTVSGVSSAIDVGVDWTNNDTFTARNGTVTLTASSGTPAIDADGTGADAFYNLVINDSGGGATYELNTAMDVDHDFTITGGNFDANGNTLTIGGSWANNDAFTSGTQTTTFDAAAGTPTIDGTGTGTSSFSTVIFNDGGNGITWQLTSDMDVNSDLTITGGTLDFNGSNTMSVAGNFTNYDAITQSTGTLKMDGTSGTKTIDMTEANGNVFNNVTFDDAGGGTTYKTKYPLDLDGNLTITGGTLDMSDAPTIWYLTNGATNASAGSWRMKSTDPAGSADDTTLCSDEGWVSDNRYCVLPPGEIGSWSAAPTSITETGWMLNNGAPVAGTIAAGAWSAKITAVYTPGNCGYTTKRLNSRLWKANADLSSPTALTGWVVQNLSEGANDYTVSLGTLSAQTLSNQVLYLEFYVTLSIQSCAGDPSATIINFRVNEGGSKQQLTTPAFTPQINIAGNWDNNDLYTHANGKVVFDASATGKTIEAGASSFYDVDVNNAAGGWTVQTDNMTVANNLSLTAGAAWALASSKTLEVDGTYSQTITGANTTWNAGSVLYFNGSGGMYDVNAKTHSGDVYVTLRIGQTEDIAMWNSSASTYVIDDSGLGDMGCLFSEDHGTTDGQLNIYGDCYSRLNEYWSYATDFDGTDISGSPRQANTKFAAGAIMTVDAGDALQIRGQNASSNRTAVTRQSSGNYSMLVSGTLDAQYYDFDYLSPAGLNFDETATITEMSDGTFDNRAKAFDPGSYINLTNTTTTKNLFRVIFDDPADGADANAQINIQAEGVGVNWTMFDWGGLNGGEDYDMEYTGAFVGWVHSETLSLSANTINFGLLNPSILATGNHDISVSTSAQGGYSCYAQEDTELQNGSFDIDDVADGTVSTGSEEFGLNCTGADCDLVADTAITTSPLTVASNSGPVTNSTTTMDYKVSVSSSTANGAYENTVTYTCSGNF